MGSGGGARRGDPAIRGARARVALRVVRTPRFIDDVSEAYAYLAEENPRSAERMFDALDAVVTLLRTFPEIGRRRDDLQRKDVGSFGCGASR